MTLLVFKKYAQYSRVLGCCGRACVLMVHAQMRVSCLFAFLLASQCCVTLGSPLNLDLHTSKF